MLGRAKKRHSTIPSWRFGAKTFSIIALFFLSCYSAYKIKDLYQFPITEVQVVGANHIDHQELQQLLMPLVNQGFFATEISLIKDRLLQLPWIADVSVRRIWPDQVIILVKERTAVARWNDIGLLSSAGDIFSPALSSYPTGLPEFVGAEGQQIYVLKFYEKINRLLLPMHFRIARLELTPDTSWSMAFDNGMKLTVGRKDVLTRLNHFVKVYPKIVGDRLGAVDYIDLRYANGLAVKWKSIT